MRWRRQLLLEADVDAHHISTFAMVLDEMGGDEHSTKIEVLLGGLAMRQWGIRVVPGQDKLDLSHYPRMFVEF